MQPTINDYALLELVSENKHTQIYRAQRRSDDSPVIIKVIKQDSMGIKNVEQLTYEFNMMSRLNSPFVIRPLELVSIQNSLILVMEDFNGKPLNYLFEEDRWDLLLYLEIAIQITSAVGDIHHQNIIHKDIKPQNILVNLETRKTKIIDFGIATQVSRELESVLNPEEVKGSIAYISPEQTGRMNRAVDFRSDIYSLGVTLYQLFSKKLPFIADSPLELIHMHIAQHPQPPVEVNPLIPRVLSEIILKCMSKEAEHRYHSAFGLRYDLEKCRQSLLATSSVSAFNIGTHDVFDHFNFPEKLYGRSKELTFINQCLKEVWGGESFLLTLSGYSGVGKSSLVFEAERHLPPGSGRFAYAKFDQFKHAIPYHGLIQAFQVVIQQLLTEPDDVLQEWKERILEAVGNSGKVLTDVIPEMELIIGVQPEIARGSPQENINRFNFIMVNFLKALLQPDSPLVFFIDDLHWADEPSLKLLELFFSNPTITNFLIIAAYRDNEVSPYHPLSITLKEIAAHGNKVVNLPVAPLAKESIQEMIQDNFFGPPKQAVELTELLYRKTQGNPFFTLQLLKLLYEKELFYFDKSRGYWVAQLEAIGVSQVSDNVADLVIEKLKSLPEQVTEVLKIGATMENRFDLELLAQISPLTREQLVQSLNIALQEDLILQERQQTGYLGSQAKGASLEPTSKSYRFLHDRIQQATYSLLSEEEKSKLHYAIGKAIIQSTPQAKLAEKSIDIVNHLNAADVALLNGNEKSNLIELNLAAGLRAKDSAAYLSAIQYFSKGIDLLSAGNWENDYARTMELHKNLALCLMITGSHQRAQEMFDLCLSKAKTVLEKAEIYQDLIFLYSQIQQYAQSLDVAAKALQLFGYHFEIHPKRLVLARDLIVHKFKMLFRKVEEMERLSLAQDQNIQAVLNIVAALLYPAMVIGNKALFVQCSLTIVELSWAYGVSKHTPAGLICLAMVMGSEMFKDYVSCNRYGLTAHNLALRFPGTAEAGGAQYLYYSFIQRWSHPLRDSVLPLRQNFRKILESGVGTIAAANAVYINLIGLITGDKLDSVLESIMESLIEIKKFSSRSEEMSLMIHREVCLALKGLAADFTDPRPSELTDEVLKISRANNQYVLFTMRYDVWHMVLLYLFGKYTEAEEIGKSCIGRINSFPNWIETHVFYFFYSLAIAAQMQNPTDNPERWKLLQEHLKILKRWAKASPMNYKHYHLLLQAEMARIQGSAKGIAFFEAAIEAAKVNRCTQDIALAYELFGNYYQKQNLKEMCAMLYHKALQYYAQWGAEAKCLHFRNAHADQLNLETFSLPVSPSQTLSFSATEDSKNGSLSSQQTQSRGQAKHAESSEFDINTLIDASQALSKEIVLDKLMESLMQLVIVNAGADKAFLILFENNKGKINSQIYLNQKYTPLISPIPVEEKGDELCLAALKFVTRANRELLLNNPAEEGNFRYDPYVLQKKPKSILVLPLLQKGTLNGVLYLENSVSNDAFTPKRLRLLSLLSSQIAISIENAQFYAKLEYKVRDRTKELQERNQELQEALQMVKTVQEQMIQQEKLASLGLLTSGIAHELKNPLNFVINFSLLTREQIEELFEYLRKGGELDQELQNFEKDILSSLTKVDLHGRRADDIIKGMLSHAHQGSKAAEPVNIHHMIEEAYELAFQNFRKKEPNFQSALHKNFDPELKMITGFPWDLIRIFINIFDNAFYAQALLQKGDPTFVPSIQVKTHLKDHKAILSIQDNGPGIPHEVIDKVFHPFFTTKPTGSGTGLGLSIAYDIITKQHQGTIAVTSAPGLTEFTITLPV